MHRLVGCWLALLVGACGSSKAESTNPPAEAPATETSAPELGTNGSATFTTVLGPEHGLLRPRDLAFNPDRPDELWVVDEGDGSVVIVHDMTSDHPTSERRVDKAAPHFMHKPSSIAFGAEPTSFGSSGTFGTCGESHNENGIEGATDFMGPVLWSSDLSIFAKKNPEGLGSHLDMLHDSPLCMGIAWQEANQYWTVNGESGSIVWYDFHQDHGVGLDDHSDGASLEYVHGQLQYAAGIPSHLVYRAEDAILYIADTGHGRIAKLDTKSGTKGKKLPTKELQKGGYFQVDGAVLTDVVSPGLLVAPSGLELHDDLLFVTDDATGRIAAFTLAGEKKNELDTQLGDGALAGMTFGPDGKIYFVDMKGNRVVRVDP
jgi:hypothetical protein